MLIVQPTRKSNARSPSILWDKINSRCLEGGTNSLKRFGLETIALFQTGNCLRCDARYIGQVPYAPAKGCSSHPALDCAYFITG